MTEPKNDNPNLSQYQRSQIETCRRVYVACLAAYNNGRLHGSWIEADQDVDAIRAEINKMLAASPMPMAEEWAIHDYEGLDGTQIEEFASVECIASLAAFAAEHGELGGELLQHFDGNIDDATAAFEHYAGEHKSLADFAQDLTEQTSEIPQNLENYINYEAIARDMELNGEVFTIEVGFECLHVFWSR